MIVLDNGSPPITTATIVAPPLDLADLIEHAFIDAGRRQTDWRIVPDASPHVIAVIARDNAIGLHIVGPRSMVGHVTLADRRWTIGLRLRPGASSPLRIPVAELLDRSVDTARLWGRNAGVPSEFTTPEALLNELFGICRRARREQSGHDAHVDWRRLARASRTVADLATTLGVSTRTLHSVVVKSIGLSPKRLLRIERLHAALARSRRQPRASWTEIAVQAGYADHAHLTRECRALLEEPPSAWRARCGTPSETFKTDPAPAP
jgi:AraC-like DNA-binding protein